LVSASEDKTLKVWDIETATEVHTLSSNNDTIVFDCAFSPNSKYIVSAHHPQAKIWSAETGVELQNLSGHIEIVDSCIFTLDSLRVITRSGEGVMKIWDLDGIEQASFANIGGGITGRDKASFELYDRGGTSGTIALVKRSHDTKLLSDGKRILVFAFDTLQVFDIVQGIQVATITNIDQFTHFENDGNLVIIVFSSSNHSVQIYTLK